MRYCFDDMDDFIGYFEYYFRNYLDEDDESLYFKINDIECRISSCSLKMYPITDEDYDYIDEVQGNPKYNFLCIHF